eukprot:SAG31_NODE_1233_length_9206_cov_32.480290_4_plen_87_part_00
MLTESLLSADAGKDRREAADEPSPELGDESASRRVLTPAVMEIEGSNSPDGTVLGRAEMVDWIFEALDTDRSVRTVTFSILWDFSC